MPDLPPQWAALVAHRAPPLLETWYRDHASSWLPLDVVRRWAQTRAQAWVREVRTSADMRRLLDQEPKLVPGYRLRTRRDRLEGEDIRVYFVARLEAVRYVVGVRQDRPRHRAGAHHDQLPDRDPPQHQ